MTRRKDPATKKVAGRPLNSGMLYTPELGTAICKRIAGGETLASILKDPGMPARITVQEWVVRMPEFGVEYIHAREIGQDVIAEDTMRIIDATPDMEPVYDRDGNIIEMRLHAAYVQWQKNRVEQRMRLLKAWNPRKYGDRQVIAGDPDAPLKVEHDLTSLDAVLEAAQLKRQSDNAGDS